MCDANFQAGGVLNVISEPANTKLELFIRGILLA